MCSRPPQDKLSAFHNLVKRLCWQNCGRIIRMSVTKAEIEKLANLSRLALSEEEKQRMCSEFAAILGYIAAIQKISSESAKRERSIVAAVNVMREDKDPHKSGIYTEALVGGAPHREGNYIKVKKIL